MRTISSWFETEMAKQTLQQVLRRFKYDGTYYYSYVDNYGTTLLDAKQIMAGSTSLGLINTDKTWNMFLTDITNLRKEGIVDFALSVDVGKIARAGCARSGISISNLLSPHTNCDLDIDIPLGGEWIEFFTGLGDETRFEKAYLNLQLRDKMTKMLEKKVGSGRGPVDYYTNSYNPADLVWDLLTVHGGLDSATSTANTDIDYTLWSDWWTDCDDLSLSIGAELEGEYIGTVLEKVGYLTHTIIFIRGDGKIAFYRYLPLGSTVYTFDDDNTHNQEVNQTFDDLLNDIRCYYNYSPTTILDTWVEKAPKLGDETVIDSLAEFNSKLYGGTNVNGKLYEWNGADAWVEVAPKLGDETVIYSLAEFDGKLYGGTGENGKLYEWNGTNAWVEKAPKLGDETRIYALAVFNGKLYGGTTQNGKLYEWDGDDEWVEVAPKLGTETAIPSLAVFNGKLYGGTGPNGKLYEWNGTNAWVEKAPKLGDEIRIFSLVVFNNKLYGGTSANGKLYEWNGTNAWVEKAPKLGDELVIHSLAVFNDKLYGGTNVNGKLYEWNGTNAWVEKAPKLGSETDIRALVEFNSKLYGGTEPNGKLYEWDDIWAGSVTASDATSQTNYGKVSHTEANTAVWHVTEASAQEFCNREIARRKDPKEYCSFDTGIMGFVFEPGDLIDNDISFYGYSSNVFEIRRLEFNLNTGETRIEMLKVD